MSAWLPISTAPRIDTPGHEERIDLWVVDRNGENGFRATGCYWDDGCADAEGHWVEGFGKYYGDKVMADWMEYRATHWMPIPDGPP